VKVDFIGLFQFFFSKRVIALDDRKSSGIVYSCFDFAQLGILVWMALYGTTASEDHGHDKHQDQSSVERLPSLPGKFQSQFPQRTFRLKTSPSSHCTTLFGFKPHLLELLLDAFFCRTQFRLEESRNRYVRFCGPKPQQLYLFPNAFRLDPPSSETDSQVRARIASSPLRHELNNAAPFLDHIW
jgi:hypothetical protein